VTAAHSIIPMSSAARRVQCPASAVLELMHPESEDRQAALDGEASHELLRLMVLSYARGGADWPDRDRVVGEASPNGTPYDSDMHDGALVCARDVAGVMRRTGVFGGERLSVEQPVHAPRIHAESWGTPDIWLYDQRERHLFVWDYKYGHRPVEAIGNRQCVEYVAGVLDTLRLEDQGLTVTITIVQPRAPHPEGTVRRWEVPATDLRGYINQASDAAHRALSADPDMNTGPECLDCKARHACSMLQRKAGAAMDYAGRSESQSLSPDGLSTELTLLAEAEQAVKARRTGLEAQAEATITAGHRVPGYTLETTYGRLKWMADPQTVATAGDLLGVDIRKPLDVITPKQAMDRGVDSTTIDQWAGKSVTGSKLKRTESSRASRVFGASQTREEQ